MKLNHHFTLTTCILVLSATPGLAQTPSSAPPDFKIAAAEDISLQPMGTIILNDRRLTRFRDLVHRAKLESILNAQGAFTVFAPINAAITNLPDKTQKLLKEDTQYRKAFIMSHVFPGKMTSDFLKKTDAIRSLSTREVLLTNDKNEFLINNFPLVTTDINASNGVLHIVSGSLLLE